MYCFVSTETNPHFNIALEEYLLNTKKDYLLLYYNEPSVIVGKHQNALAETNHNYVVNNGIPLVRRISGGGTVYHDLGNLNYAFINTVDVAHKVNFERHTFIIINALSKMGIKAQHSEKSNITLCNKKISGNASHVFKNRVMHHGTLLYDTNLTILEEAVRPSGATYNDKSVKSIRRKTTLIKPHLTTLLTPFQFAETLLNYIAKQLPASTSYKLSLEDDRAIRKLVAEKYTQWQWNYAYSPKYQFENQYSMSNKKTIGIKFYVEQGVIKTCIVEGDYFSSQEKEVLQTLLVGTPHHFSNIELVFGKIKNASFYQKILGAKLIKRLF